MLDRYWWSTVVYGQCAGMAGDTLDALIEPERRMWAEHPAIIFLVDRDNPIDRDEEPQYWNKLRQPL